MHHALQSDCRARVEKARHLLISEKSFVNCECRTAVKNFRLLGGDCKMGGMGIWEKHITGGTFHGAMNDLRSMHDAGSHPGFGPAPSAQEQDGCH